MARYFGIEIEFEGNVQHVLNELTREGICNGVMTNYTGQAPAPYWSLKLDGSVSSGGELVSPKLDFNDPEVRIQLSRVVKALADAGAKPCQSAGIHVHVDGTDLTAKQVAMVVRSFAKFEDVIYRIASSGWQQMRYNARRYCRPYTREKYLRFSRVETDAALATALYGVGERARYRMSDHGDNARYAGLNVHSWFYRKTLEFRVFNSSVNPERIQGYVAMCVALVEDARRGNIRSINRTFPLGGMLSGATKPDAALHRFLQILRYEAGMSAEDVKRIRFIWKNSVPQSDFADRVA